jgi:hypothetical protein
MSQEIPNVFGDFMVMNHPEVVKLREREKHNAYMRAYSKKGKWKAYIKKYNKTEKAKTWRENYNQLPQNKILAKRYQEKYNLSPKAKVRSERWRKSEKGAAYQKKFKTSVEGRNYNRLYSQKYIAERKKTDPLFKIQRNLRLRNHYIRILAANPNIRSNSRAIVDYLGLPPQDGKKYHIDHIKPLCSFDLSNPSQVKLATAPENHRWLPASENARKAAEDRKKSIKYGKK